MKGQKDRKGVNELSLGHTITTVATTAHD